MAAALHAHVGADKPVVVACSGGPDSSAAAVAVARVHRGPVTLAHFDHGLQGREAAAAECAAVERLSAVLGAAVVHGHARGRLATGEAGARTARYRWLASACRSAGAATCVVAHTLDDQAETVLLHLTRGSGPDGAGGMLACAPWPVPSRYGASRHLVRPLLGLRRAEVASYIAALGIAAMHDPTNDAVTFARNRVRHRVLPELRAINPRAEEALAHFAALAAADAAALDRWADHELRRARREAAPPDEDAVLLDRAVLRALPEAVAGRVLRRAVAGAGLTLGGAQTAAALRGLARTGTQVVLAGGYLAIMPKLVRISRQRP